MKALRARKAQRCRWSGGRGRERSGPGWTSRRVRGESRVRRRVIRAYFLVSARQRKGQVGRVGNAWVRGKDCWCAEVWRNAMRCNAEPWELEAGRAGVVETWSSNQPGNWRTCRTGWQSMLSPTPLRIRQCRTTSSLLPSQIHQIQIIEKFIIECIHMSSIARVHLKCRRICPMSLDHVYCVFASPAPMSTHAPDTAPGREDIYRRPTL